MLSTDHFQAISFVRKHNRTCPSHPIEIRKDALFKLILFVLGLIFAITVGSLSAVISFTTGFAIILEAHCFSK
jgi:heme O synthase-like polyprenyltransferase